MKRKIFISIMAETPLIWKRIRLAAASIGVSAIALIAANVQLELALLPIIITVCKYTIALCVIITGQASLKTTTPNE